MTSTTTSGGSRLGSMKLAAAISLAMVTLAACGSDDRVTYAPACDDVCDGNGVYCNPRGGCGCGSPARCSDREEYCHVACLADNGHFCEDGSGTSTDCQNECVAREPDGAWCPPPAPDMACSECPVSAACDDAGCECDDGTACDDR